MSEVENGKQRQYTKWGLAFLPAGEPYEEFDTYEDALAAFEGMKVKHQYDEHIVRVDYTVTEVYNGDHWDWEDAYGSRSAKAGIIEAISALDEVGQSTPPHN